MSGVAASFARLMGRRPDCAWSAPGRVNLIGEHTDYNQGLVLPIAIDRAATVALARRADGLVRCRSLQMPEEVVIAVSDILPGRVDGWASYPLGVLWAMTQDGRPVPGLDIVIDSDVPAGAGLASSAAVEVALGRALAELTGEEVSSEGLARMCQAGEQSVAGAPTGLMDPLAALEGRASHALLIDCRSLDREHVPFPSAEAAATLLVIDTTVVHGTGGAGYRTRREECADAADQLGVESLRDASLGDVDGRLTGLLQRRARHVVTENERVTRTASLLRDGELRLIGPLLTASHTSLRDDYEVSCAELDLAVHAAIDAGAWGARMTGAGFGGCAIALVPSVAAENVADALQSAFARHRFAPPKVFPVSAADGAHRCG